MKYVCLSDRTENPPSQSLAACHAGAVALAHEGEEWLGGLTVAPDANLPQLPGQQLHPDSETETVQDLLCLQQESVAMTGMVLRSRAKAVAENVVFRAQN